MAAWRYGDIFTCLSESSPGVSLVFINIIKQFQHYYCIEDVTYKFNLLVCSVASL